MKVAGQHEQPPSQALSFLHDKRGKGESLGTSTSWESSIKNTYKESPVNTRACTLAMTC